EDPLALLDYNALETDRAGLTVTIAEARVDEIVLIARIEGITNRNAAESLGGLSLYVRRDRLPAPDDEDDFYPADLIGLEARLEDGSALGRVLAVVNFGADDLLDIRLEGSRRSVYFPFTRAVVPLVDIAGGYLVVVPPEGWLEDTLPDPGEVAEP